MTRQPFSVLQVMQSVLALGLAVLVACIASSPATTIADI